MPSWNETIISSIFLEIASFPRTFHKVSRDIVSKALVKSTKTMRSFFPCFFWRKIISYVLRPDLNPQQLSGEMDHTRFELVLFKITRARILPAIEKREMPRWLLHSRVLSSWLYRWIIEVPINCSGTNSGFHMTTISPLSVFIGCLHHI